MAEPEERRDRAALADRHDVRQSPQEPGTPGVPADHEGFGPDEHRRVERAEERQPARTKGDAYADAYTEPRDAD